MRNTNIYRLGGELRRWVGNHHHVTLVRYDNRGLNKSSLVFMRYTNESKPMELLTIAGSESITKVTSSVITALQWMLNSLSFRKRTQWCGVT